MKYLLLIFMSIAHVNGAFSQVNEELFKTYIYQDQTGWRFDISFEEYQSLINVKIKEKVLIFDEQVLYLYTLHQEDFSTDTSFSWNDDVKVLSILYNPSTFVVYKIAGFKNIDLMSFESDFKKFRVSKRKFKSFLKEISDDSVNYLEIYKCLKKGCYVSFVDPFKFH